MIVGVPCVGKSLLMRQLMTLDQPWHHQQIPYIHYHMTVTQTYMGREPTKRETPVIVIGRYDEPHKYPGTDRLSMACQPRVIRFIKRRLDKASILFEGDRLGNISMLEQLVADGHDVELIHLYLRDEWLNKRRAEQRQDQNEKFWKSRNTKVNNLTKWAIDNGVAVRSFEHVTISDTHNIIAYLRKERF